MELVEQIRKMGLRVEPFVLRVEGVLDLYLPSGKYGFHTFKWHDLRTHERGRKPLDQLSGFVAERLKGTNHETLSDLPMRRDARRQK